MDSIVSPTSPSMSRLVSEIPIFLASVRKPGTVVLNEDGFYSDMRSDLKEPKHEIFEHRVFPQISNVPVGDLGTRPKNANVYDLGLILTFL
jgi:hypothetical protein